MDHELESVVKISKAGRFELTRPVKAHLVENLEYRHRTAYLAFIQREDHPIRSTYPRCSTQNFYRCINYIHFQRESYRDRRPSVPVVALSPHQIPFDGPGI